VSAQIRPELIDDLMQTYVDWRQECIALQGSYERWSDAPDEERETAFAAYRAALDREEQASAVFAERTERVACEQEGRDGYCAERSASRRLTSVWGPSRT
jgi:hypothetical protein